MYNYDEFVNFNDIPEQFLINHRKTVSSFKNEEKTKIENNDTLLMVMLLALVFDGA